MSGYGNTRLLQGRIQNRTKFRRGNHTIDFLPIDEDRGGGIYAESVALAHGGLYGVLVLRLDAGLQLGLVQVVLLTLLCGQAVERPELLIPSLLRTDLTLIGVKIVSHLPVGVTALRSQTVGIDGGVRGPGMNFGQGIVLVNEFHAVAIFLQNLRKQSLVHAGAERAFEIVVIYDYDLGVFVAADGAIADADFLYVLGIRILGEVELGHPHQSFAVFREQEVVVGFLFGAVHVNRKRVITGKVAGAKRTDGDFHRGGDGIVGTHLTLDAGHLIGRHRLRRTTQANQNEDKNRPPHK